jgi:hypothetical protein
MLSASQINNNNNNQLYLMRVTLNSKTDNSWLKLMADTHGPQITELSILIMQFNHIPAPLFLLSKPSVRQVCFYNQWSLVFNINHNINMNRITNINFNKKCNLLHVFSSSSPSLHSIFTLL